VLTTGQSNCGRILHPAGQNNWGVIFKDLGIYNIKRMFIYKLICSETNKVYFGATKNTPEYRKTKGHYNCTCKDFIKPTIEIVEKCNDIEHMYQREKYYIQHFDCVNTNGKYDATSKEYKQKANIKSLEPIECDICGAFTSKKHIARHKKSHLCVPK